MSYDNVVIYHADCADGFASAWAARQYLGDCKFISCQYQNPPPIIERGDKVYIVDFSFPREVLLSLSKIHEVEIIVLDHHKTAQANLEGDWPANVSVLFDMEKCGARLTWEHFFPEAAVPELIQYIEDRDLWKWQLTGSKEVSAAIRSYPFDFNEWDNFKIEQLYSEGRAILRYMNQQISTLAKLAQRRTIAGYDVPIINAPAIWASEICNILAQNEPFAASYATSETDIFWSLRSAEDGVDVSEIAKQFGGGGHKHAAGYKTTRSVRE